MAKHRIAMFNQIAALLFVAESVKAAMEMDFDSQLKLINKPAITSFQTEYGDMIDCVEMYKQLAFDHPLLKNHTIQMMPEITPEVSEEEASKPYMLKTTTCPSGSVPIRRATRGDLLMKESMKALGFNSPSNDFPGHEGAVITYKLPVYGTQARLSIWSPSVMDNQLSLGGLWIVNGLREEASSIQAGWIVRNYMGQKVSRLYTYWTSDNYRQTGCFDTLCPGFVQVSTQIPLGSILEPSAYGGTQKDMLLSLYQDRATGNWWLLMDNNYVGYWPKALLPGMANGAKFTAWGGQVFSPLDVPSPEMGSGHKAAEGFGHAAYALNVQLMSEAGAAFADPNDQDLNLWTNAKNCYDAEKGESTTAGWGHYVFYGGPGKCTFSP